MKENIIIFSIIFSLAIFLLLLIGSCTHTFLTCDGHVVKNFFDWPVCVPRGN